MELNLTVFFHTKLWNVKGKVKKNSLLHEGVRLFLHHCFKVEAVGDLSGGIIGV